MSVPGPSLLWAGPQKEPGKGGKGTQRSHTPRLWLPVVHRVYPPFLALGHQGEVGLAPWHKHAEQEGVTLAVPISSICSRLYQVAGGGAGPSLKS